MPDNNIHGYEIISVILSAMVAMAKEGVKTIEINNKAEELIKFYNVKSVNKGFYPPHALKPFPAATCININDEIAHGIPGERTLINGDIVSFDLGIIDSYGQCADAAISVGVGEISNAKKRLLYYAYKTMMEGVGLLRAGTNTETIARLINQYAATRGYRVNRRFAGHAIGREMHGKPNIYNTQENTHKYAVLQERQIFCVEPMLTNGRDDIGVMNEDGWVCITRDGNPSAFFEVMVEVTKDGPKILTNHITPPEL